MILFQGTEDKVVPPNQAQAMYDALAAKGIPTSLIMFEGEQHGFRQSANIRRYLVHRTSVGTNRRGLESVFQGLEPIARHAWTGNQTAWSLRS